LYFQLLIAASLAIAGYFDVKERLVSDLVWIPALAGAGLVIYFDPSFGLLLKLGLVGGVGLAFAWYGAVGEADAIAFAFVTADIYLFSPIPALLATGVVIAVHLAYLYFAGFIGKPKVVSLAQFRAEARWIPRAVFKGEVRTEVKRNVNLSRELVEEMGSEGAMVEVQYGVPDVAYIAVGYAVYLVYLVVTQPAFFFSFP
jgi:hypothetical protein